MVVAILLISLAFVFYTYFGYAVLLWIVRLLKGCKLRPAKYIMSRVTIIIPAYNEESTIVRALASIADLRYPPELIETIVVSDGSSDCTDDVVMAFTAIPVRLIRIKQRSGRNAALARAFPEATGEILVTIDASSALHADALSRLVRHFSDPRVGSCVGSKTISRGTQSIAEGDGLYWRYEAKLRELESQTGSSWVGVEGGLYAVRKSLVRLNFSDHLAPDYAIGCHINQSGYQNRYDSSAIVYELPTVMAKHEFRRKVRVIVRGIQAFWAYRRLLNPISNTAFFFQTVSHKLFRWIVPFFLVLVFATSLIGARSSYLVLGVFVAQIVFYVLAMIGYMMNGSAIRHWLFSVPLYFVVVNVSCLVAWFSLSKPITVWEPTERVFQADQCEIARLGSDDGKRQGKTGVSGA